MLVEIAVHTGSLKDATGGKLKDRVDKVLRTARAKAAGQRSELAGLIVHADLDSLDGPNYSMVRDRLTQAFALQLPSVSVALAVWETEAWLLLFPAAFAAYRKGWSVPKARCGRDTGLFQDPKRILREELGSPYRESDAPKIMKKAVELGLTARPGGTNRSYTDFLASTRDLAASIR
jgi:hypothetical protein